MPLDAKLWRVVVCTFSVVAACLKLEFHQRQFETQEFTIANVDLVCDAVLLAFAKWFGRFTTN
jgi:hypothetical protein